MNDEKKIALEQFRNVVSYLQYENTIYWTRSGFILTAQAALLGFNARLVPVTKADATWPSVSICLGICVVALLVCWLGLKMIDNSILWIDRWIKLLQRIEATAYGNEYEVFRNIDAPIPGKLRLPRSDLHFARDTARYLIYVFIGAWLTLVVYILHIVHNM